MDAATKVPFPHNEKVLDYAPGSVERKQLEARLEELGWQRHDLTMTIDGEQRMAGGAA